MDELELGGKMRKSHDMRQSEMNLAQQQLVGFGMLPDQVTASRQDNSWQQDFDWDMCLQK